MSDALDPETLVNQAADLPRESAGAVDVLLATTPSRSADALRAQARRYRRLAMSVDPETATQLEAFGVELDDQADRTGAVH